MLYKKIIVIILSFTIFILLVNDSRLQWISKNNGLNGGSINSIKYSNGKLYACTMYGGAYMSSNGGNNWMSINNDIQNYYVQDVAIKGDVIFSGCNGQGLNIRNYLFRSSNGGNNWEVTQNGFPYPADAVNSLLFFGNYVFAGANSGIYRTNNDKNNIWSRVGAPEKFVYTIIIHGNVIFAGTNSYVYRSLDSGNTWQHIVSGIGNNFVVSLCSKDNKIFAGTNDGIYVSTNNGENWSGVNNGLTNKVILSFETYNNILFAGGQGLFKSTDDGLNWIKINSLFESDVFSLCYDGANLFAGLAFLNGGVYKSTNDGLDFEKSDYGLNAIDIWGLTSIDNYIFAASDGYGVLMSSDFGESWELRNNGLKTIFVRPVIAKGTNLFTGEAYDIYRSTDYGLNWESTLNIKYTLSLYPDNETVYAGTFYRGIYLTTNNGLNWNLKGLETADIRAITKKENLIFVGTDTEGMYLSSNSGDNWIEINYGLPNPCFLYARALTTLGDNVFLGNVWHGGVYITTNNGINWQKRNKQISDSVVFAFSKKDSTLIASNFKDGLFISKDLGQNWICKGEELKGKDVRALWIVGDYLFAGCMGFGVWRRPISEIVFVKQISNLVPVQNQLYQNYPNPFNSSTIIKYQLKKENYITIKIYDIIGREVKTLVNGSMEAGTYQTEWNAEGLPSGIYFCRIKAVDFTAVKSMMLIK